MTEIVFCRTVHTYQSYSDLFRLAELAGFSIISANDLELTRPCVYIVAPDNGDWDGHIEACEKRSSVRNAHLIHWDIERPSGSAGSIGAYGERQRQRLYSRAYDEVWVSDRRLAAETELRFVPLGSHPDFGQPGQDKQWSAVHLSYAIPRRQKLYSQINGMHRSQHPAGAAMPACWGDMRDTVLKKSRFGLATHQDDHPFLEPLRMAIFAAYGLPTLCETVFDPYPYGGDTVEFVSYDHLVPRLNKLLGQDYEPWRQKGQRMRELMTEEFEFGKVVREAVAQRIANWR